MRPSSKLRYLSLVVGSLLIGALATANPVLAHEALETTPEPGFRPQSIFAADFVDDVGTVNLAVLPSIVRRAERTAHSFDSQDRIVAFLNQSGIATAATKSKRIDLGPLRRPSQWEIFEYGAETIGAGLEGYKTGADYVLVMEFLIPEENTIFGIEVYILDRHGRNAFSFLLNSHHRMFVEAKLFTRNSSEAARQALIVAGTRLGLTALEAQIEKARECLASSAANQPIAIEAGKTFDELLVETRLDEKSSRIVLEPDQWQGRSVDKAMQLTCALAKITTERGYRYFSTDERAELADGRKSFRITFYTTLPAGVPLASRLIHDGDAQEAELMDAAIDTREVRQACALLK